MMVIDVEMVDVGIGMIAMDAMTTTGTIDTTTGGTATSDDTTIDDRMTATTIAVDDRTMIDTIDTMIDADRMTTDGIRIAMTDDATETDGTRIETTDAATTRPDTIRTNVTLARRLRLPPNRETCDESHTHAHVLNQIKSNQIKSNLLVALLTFSCQISLATRRDSPPRSALLSSSKTSRRRSWLVED